MEKKNGVLTDVGWEDIEILKKNPRKFWKGVKEIGERAFYWVQDFPNDEIVIPEGITKIHRNAFEHKFSDPTDPSFYSRLKKVTFPESLESIGDEAFKGCVSLRIVTFPEKMKLGEIGTSSFANCSSLESLNFPESLETIGASAFDHCKKLKTVTFPKNGKLKRLYSSCFGSCESLESVVLPDSLEIIESWAFSGCRHLKNFKVSNDSKLYYVEKSAFIGTPLTCADLDCPFEIRSMISDYLPTTLATKEQLAREEAAEKQIAEKRTTEQVTEAVEETQINQEIPAQDNVEAVQSQETQNKQEAEQAEVSLQSPEIPASTVELPTKKTNIAFVDDLFGQLASGEIDDVALKNALSAKLDEIAPKATIAELKEFQQAILDAQENFRSALQDVYSKTKDTILGL